MFRPFSVILLSDDFYVWERWTVFRKSDVQLEERVIEVAATVNNHKTDQSRPLAAFLSSRFNKTKLLIISSFNLCKNGFNPDTGIIITSLKPERHSYIHIHTVCNTHHNK